MKFGPEWVKRTEETLTPLLDEVKHKEEELLQLEVQFKGRQREAKQFTTSTSGAREREESPAVEDQSPAEAVVDMANMAVEVQEDGPENLQSCTDVINQFQQ